MFGEVPGRLKNVNLLALGSQIIVPQQVAMDGSELFFLPLGCFAVLRTFTGAALTTSPKFRIGGNVAHNDCVPLYTVPLAATVGQVAMPSVVAPPFTPPNLRAGDIVFEITQAGIGPTVLLGDVFIYGLGLSG